MAVQPWPVWQQARSATLPPEHFMENLTERASPASSQEVGSCILKPDSLRRLTWDVLGLFLLFADLVWIPMQVFDPPETTSVKVLGWTTLIYWTLDIAFSLNSGFFHANHVVMGRKAILINYMKTWMVLDLALVSFEWSMLLRKYQENIRESAGVARLGRIARVSRIIRLLRLLRLAKLKQLLFTVQSVIGSEWLIIVFAVAKNLFVLLAINHIIACLWFALGSSMDYPNSWVEAYDLQDRRFELQYLIAAHWSLAQFTPGAEPIKPQGIAERTFAVLVLVLGLVVSTCFLSSITSTVSAVWSMNRYNTTQAFLLKKFLHQNRISRRLAVRVTRYVDFVVELRHRKVHHSKAHFLSLLSGPLHNELQYELFMSRVSTHPFFREMNSASKCCMTELCSTAMVSANLAKHDTIFYRAQVSHCMYFIVNGSLAYCQYTVSKGRRVGRLDEGLWSCEPVLWTPWEHRGEMKAISEADLLEINARHFREVTLLHGHAFDLARNYATNFLHSMGDIFGSRLAELPDVPIDILPEHYRKSNSRDLNRARLAEDMSVRHVEFAVDDQENAAYQADLAREDPPEGEADGTWNGASIEEDGRDEPETMERDEPGGGDPATESTRTGDIVQDCEDVALFEGHSHVISPDGATIIRV